MAAASQGAIFLRMPLDPRRCMDRQLLWLAWLWLLMACCPVAWMETSRSIHSCEYKSCSKRRDQLVGWSAADHQPYQSCFRHGLGSVRIPHFWPVMWASEHVCSQMRKHPGHCYACGIQDHEQWPLAVVKSGIGQKSDNHDACMYTHNYQHRFVLTI